VGNTHGIKRCAHIPTVHPHGCGEHSCGTCSITIFSGSSPRMWGTRIPAKHRRQARRFIPTDVGNTVIPGRRRLGLSVHPHGCGEHANINITDIETTGSSPRMWGTPVSDPKKGTTLRFIPTDVGNTSPLFFFLFFDAVHPHGCGEHSKLIPLILLRKNST